MSSDAKTSYGDIVKRLFVVVESATDHDGKCAILIKTHNLATLQETHLFLMGVAMTSALKTKPNTQNKL